jgi:ActR/RegA family two-component response regulator
MRVHVKGERDRAEVMDQVAETSAGRGTKRRIRPRMSLLLVDDDPIYLKVMERAATREGIAVTGCRSIGELEAVAISGVFDAAVVDYYLDGIHSELRGTALASRIGSTPTILVSQKDECVSESDPWPSNVRQYLSKRSGPRAILAAALQMKKRPPKGK